MFGKAKKFRPLTEYPEQWTVAQGTHDGKPLFIRVQSSLKDAVGHPLYPHQIGVAVPLLHPTEEGMPQTDESEELDAIEDGLCGTLRDARLVAAITTNGMREFVFYAKDWKPQEFEAQVETVNQAHADHQLQFMMQQDPSWSTFKSLLS